MESSSDSELEVPNISRKTKGKRKLYKRDIIKKARLSGAEYTKYKGVLVPSKGQGDDCR